MTSLGSRRFGDASKVSRVFYSTKRWILPLFIGVLSVLAACIKSDPEVSFTFDNKTDSLLCYFPNSGLARGGFCEADIQPHEKRAWGQECGPHDPDSTEAAVVLTVGPRGQVIYHKAATCKQWNDANAKITIEQRGDQFVVTDSLPGATPSP